MVPENPDSEPGIGRSKLLSLISILAVTALLAVAAYLILRPFAEVILAASMLTVCFYPLYEWIHARVRNADAAAAICVLTLLVVLLAPLAVLGTVVAKEAQSAYSGIESQSAAYGGWANYLGHAADGPVQWVSSQTGISADEIKSAIAERAQATGARIISWSGKLAGNIAATTTDILLTLFIMLFLFPIGARFGQHLHEYVPIRKDRLDLILETMKSAIVANLYGMIAVAASQGALVGIGFALTGLPSPVFWAVAASFCSLIPLVGTAFIVVPAVAYLSIGGAYGKALFLLVWGVIVVGMSDNFVRPLVLKKGIEMNTLAIFLSLMGGVQAFGFIGLFAGPVILTMAFVMLRMLNEERLAWQNAGIQEPTTGPAAAEQVERGQAG